MLSRTLPAGTLLAALVLAGCADDAQLPTQADGAARLARAPEPAMLPTPVFDLEATSSGTILVARPEFGITELRNGSAELVTLLSGASGVAANGRGHMMVVTAEPPISSTGTSRKLFRVSRGRAEVVADIWAFEQAVNPDASYNPVPHSNPFGIALLNGGEALVADAAGNDLLIVDQRGNVDWVALFPTLPNTGPFGPPNIQPVPTSVAVGPDGAYYVGELTGFPAWPGLSRIWRIEPGSLHVTCPSAACTLVADGFTSIMDLAFGPDGTLYVAEFDEAGWFAVEMTGGTVVAGGSVNACNVETGACSVVATGLDLVTAITVTKDGTVWIAESAFLFGTAHVHPLP